MILKGRESDEEFNIDGKITGIYTSFGGESTAGPLAH